MATIYAERDCIWAMNDGTPFWAYSICDEMISEHSSDASQFLEMRIETEFVDEFVVVNVPIEN